MPRPTNSKTDAGQLREKLFIWFQQWVSIFQRSPSPEKAFVPFITQLTKQGILKMDDVSSFFFRACAESSVNSYTKSVTSRHFSFPYSSPPISPISRPLLFIITYH